MTEPSIDSQVRPAPRRPAAPARRPGGAAVLWGSIALFAALFAFLTYQVEAGNDPLLGAAGSRAASSPPPVLVRQVVKRRIVTTVLPGPGGSSVSASGGSAGLSSAGATPIVTGAS